MKAKCICFLFIFCLIFTFPVLAVPNNVYSTNIDVRFETVQGTYLLDNSFPSGSIWSRAFFSPSSDNYVSLINYSGSVPFTYDLYIAVLTSSLPYISFGGIDSYYYAPGNLQENISVTNVLYNYNGSLIANNPVTSQTSESVTFLYFKDVPAGTTFLVNIVNPFPPTGISYVHEYSSLASANVDFAQFLFGFYFGYTKVSGDDLVSEYEKGNISLNDAISGINTIVKDSVSGTADYTESTLNVLIGQSQIDEILRISGQKSLNNLRDNLVPSFDNIINNYVDGSLSIDETLTSMNTILQNGLSDSDTVEQGTLVNTCCLL